VASCALRRNRVAPARTSTQLKRQGLEIYELLSTVTAPTHTEPVFDIYQMPQIVQWAEQHVYSLKAEAIVACGHSGLVVAGALSYLTRVPVIAVRKAAELEFVRAGGALSARMTSASLAKAVDRWVWLDDLISVGTTYKHARAAIKDAGLVTQVDPAGVILYNDDSFRYEDGAWRRELPGLATVPVFTRR